MSILCPIFCRIQVTEPDAEPDAAPSVEPSVEPPETTLLSAETEGIPETRQEKHGVSPGRMFESDLRWISPGFKMDVRWI